MPLAARSCRRAAAAASAQLFYHLASAAQALQKTRHTQYELRRLGWPKMIFLPARRIAFSFHRRVVGRFRRTYMFILFKQGARAFA